MMKVFLICRKRMKTDSTIAISELFDEVPNALSENILISGYNTEFKFEK